MIKFITLPQLENPPMQNILPNMRKQRRMLVFVEGVFDNNELHAYLDACAYLSPIPDVVDYFNVPDSVQIIPLSWTSQHENDPFNLYYAERYGIATFVTQYTYRVELHHVNVQLHAHSKRVYVVATEFGQGGQHAMRQNCAQPFAQRKHQSPGAEQQRGPRLRIRHAPLPSSSGAGPQGQASRAGRGGG